jgi:hypothetical protein
MGSLFLIVILIYCAPLEEEVLRRRQITAAVIAVRGEVLVEGLAS